MTEEYKTFVEEEAQWAARAAIEKISQHGNDALSEAQREIRDSQARGDFTRAGSWVLVCRRIQELQHVKDLSSDIRDRTQSAAAGYVKPAGA